MNKREISKYQHDFTTREMAHFASTGVITETQKEIMMGHYIIKQQQNLYLRFLLAFGALLLGLGVLSFVASNWSYLDKPMKFLIIVVSMVGANFVGYKLEASSPKTSRSLYYLGILIFGAGIFLIGQMFNIGGDYYQAFLVWGIGAIFIGAYLKDVVILTFTTGLFFLYGILILIESTITPYVLIPLVVGLYLVNRYIGYSTTLTFSTNMLSIFLFVYIFGMSLDELNISFEFLFLVLFVAGIGFLYTPVPEKIKNVFRFQGHVIHACAGITLTFGDVWKIEPMAIAFSLLYAGFIMYLVKQSNLFGMFMAGLLVLRFYVDISYDFMPKSLVFIIGGLILLAMCYSFEKQRKKGGDEHDKITR